MMGQLSYPFKDSFIVGLELVAMIRTYDLIGPAHAAPSVYCAITVSVQ